ncbi:MAG TPA: alpha-amylase family protein [Candidatus Scybalocola faecipullorum]|nr:alpha-amylase family protein [Candidatus Scybalocola faecipullorum]
MAKGSVRRKKADEYAQRLAKHYDELKWLYCELYNGREDMFEQLCERMMQWYTGRSEALKRLDREREANPDWYKKQDMLGMMLYIDAFSENISNLEKKLAYLKECNVNYLHLMPFLKTPKGKSDGGYAVADYRTVQENLGTMAQLDSLAQKCHKKGISLCMDFVMNHTSEEHEWAQRALAGDKEYQDRYFFFDSYEIPAEYEKTCPQVFPTTAPGNFTWRADCKKYVMTTFYPYQWDLNYANPVVFNEMVYNMLYLVNRGIDIVRIDAVPYIWKQLGTSCRNLPQVHTIVRMMRMITEIVCPGVVLLGEVVMEPEKVVPYFGTVEKPECHMLYNVTTMASTWHTVAVKNVSLLKHQMDIVSALPKQYVFLNYLRCHDDIGWGLDYEYLKQFGFSEPAHKKFLNDYFRGLYPGSDARGELYNDDPVLQDARLCGTTASLCGLEAAIYEQDEEKMARAVKKILMLHAYLLVQSGIPVIYSGDEIGQLNDCSYKESDDADKAADSRYIHRGKFQWAMAAKRHQEGTTQQQIFEKLSDMENIRFAHDIFSGKASVKTENTYNDAILCVCRELDNAFLVGLFNFSDEPQTAWINMGDFEFEDLISGEKRVLQAVEMSGNGYAWYYRTW